MVLVLSFQNKAIDCYGNHLVFVRKPLWCILVQNPKEVGTSKLSTGKIS
jgi:hypothetical protein